MVLAEIDMSPYLSIGLGGLMCLTCGWYWHRLGRQDIEPSRRGIRRASLVLAVLAIFALVRAASFVDYKIDPGGWVTSWLAAIGLLFLFLLLVAMDLLNSFLIYRRLLMEDALTAARELHSTVEGGSGNSLLPAEGDGAEDD